MIFSGLFAAIDTFSRMRVGNAYENQSTYSCVTALPSFDDMAAWLNVSKHKPVRPYTPRHNGSKRVPPIERSHREDRKRFHDVRDFYLAVLIKSLCAYRGIAPRKMFLFHVLVHLFGEPALGGCRFEQGLCKRSRHTYAEILQRQPPRLIIHRFSVSV